MTGAGPLAIGMFVVVVAVTLAITVWAARRTKSAPAFYAANSTISGAQNGLAISGDFMSAGTLLGVTALFFSSGFDAIIYILTPLLGFTLVLLLMAEPIRNLGRYTVADVLAARLDEKPVRAFSVCATLTASVLYLIGQVVGAGALIQILFGISYANAVVIIGVLMMTYVSLGGMFATTWVQITKAAALIVGVVLMTILLLVEFDFDLAALYGRAIDAHARGIGLLAPGGLTPSVAAAISLSLALVFGLAGSPHILMRFFTVPDAAEARRSMFIALLIIAFVFFQMFFFVGFGAVALVTDDPRFLNDAGQIVGGDNMVSMHLANVLGGDVFLGFMSAVAFATILAVVAGLTLAASAAVSHDFYANLLRAGRTSEKEEVLVSRITALVIGVLAILLGIAFEQQNIVYVVSLSLTVAASANFPVLILCLYWPGLTTRGAVVGGTIGLLTAIALVVLGPAVWVGVLGFERPVFPSPYPALVSMPVALLAIWLLSVTDPRRHAEDARAKFQALRVRAELGS